MEYKHLLINTLLAPPLPSLFCLLRVKGPGQEERNNTKYVARKYYHLILALSKVPDLQEIPASPPFNKPYKFLGQGGSSYSFLVVNIPVQVELL
jgi:hypothetical protein